MNDELPKQPIEIAQVVGSDMDEWRENVRKTELYKKGDCILVWINEGDLYMGLLNGTLVNKG